MILLQRGSNIFQGGWGGGLFPGGPNANFYRNPNNLIIWGGGGSPTPYSPSGSEHGVA